MTVFAYCFRFSKTQRMTSPNSFQLKKHIYTWLLKKKNILNKIITCENNLITSYLKRYIFNVFLIASEIKLFV